MHVSAGSCMTGTKLLVPITVSPTVILYIYMEYPKFKKMVLGVNSNHPWQLFYYKSFHTKLLWPRQLNWQTRTDTWIWVRYDTHFLVQTTYLVFQLKTNTSSVQTFYFFFCQIERLNPSRVPTPMFVSKKHRKKLAHMDMLTADFECFINI